MAGAGVKLFVAGDVLTAAEVNTYLQDQVIAVYANSTARDNAYGGTGEPTVSEGMFCFLKDTDTLQYYNGSSWVNMIVPVTFDAKGDLLTATADNTPTRLAVGTNNHVLMADSAQSAGLKYAPEATATLTATGDLLYASAANTLARLGIGSEGQTLVVTSGVPAWGAAAATGADVLQVQVFS